MNIIDAAKAVVDTYDKALEQDAHGDLDSPIEALRKAVAEPYTPMTDDEMNEVIAQWYEDDSNTHALTRQIEQAVVKRIMGG